MVAVVLVLAMVLGVVVVVEKLVVEVVEVVAVLDASEKCPVYLFLLSVSKALLPPERQVACHICAAMVPLEIL